MTRQTSIQLTHATEHQIEALKQAGYGTFTDIVRLAIDRMYRDEVFTLNTITATHTYVVRDDLDQTGAPFIVTFCDKSGPHIFGPYVDEGFADKEAAIAHAESLIGMAFDIADLASFTLYSDSRVVWTSDEKEMPR